MRQPAGSKAAAEAARAKAAAPVKIEDVAAATDGDDPAVAATVLFIYGFPEWKPAL